MTQAESFFYNNSPQYIIDLAVTDMVKSGLSIETAASCKIKIFQGTKQDIKKTLGYTVLDHHDISSTFPMLEIPYIGKDNNLIFTRYKLLTPVTLPDGGKIKYLHPKGIPPTPYIPPGLWEIADKTHEPIYLTEGEKKALCLTQYGRNAIAFSGVFNFKGGENTADVKDRDLWEDLKGFRWWGRQVFIAYDSDAWKNQAVQDALWELALNLTAINAHVHIMTWPYTDGKGIDDYLHYITSKVVNNDANVELATLEKNSHGALDAIKADYTPSIIRALAIVNMPKLIRDSFITTVAKAVHTTKALVRSAIESHPKSRKRDAVYDARKEDSDYFTDENNCVYQIVAKPDGNTKHVMLSRFSASITVERTLDDGSGLQTKVFTVEGKTKSEPLPPIHVPAIDFSAMKWPVAMWGSLGCIKAGKDAQLREAIMTTSNPIHKKEYVHTGWNKDKDGSFYLTGRGAIGRQNVAVALGDGMGRYNLPLSVTTEQAAEAGIIALSFLKVATPAVAIPLFASALLCPLVSMFEVMPNFSFFLYGDTGTFKSTLALLILSFYGDFPSLTNLANFSDTANSIERNAYMIKDAPMVIDDLHPSNDRILAQKMITTLQLIAYGAGNRTGRGRLNQDATAKQTYYPRGMVYFTSEQEAPIASTIARLFIVRINKHDVNVENLSELQKSAKYLPYFMAGYISFLQKDYDYWCNKISLDFLALRKEYLGKQPKGAHKKLPEQAAFMDIALQTGIAYMKSLNIIDADSIKDLKLQYSTISEKRAIQIRQDALEGDPIDLMFQILEALILSEQIHFLPRVQQSPTPPLGNPAANSSKAIGWVDEDAVYINPILLESTLTAFSTKQGKAFPCTHRQLCTLLINATRSGHRVLVERGKTQVSKVISVEGRARRIIALNRSLFSFAIVLKQDEIIDEPSQEDELFLFDGNNTQGDS